MDIRHVYSITDIQQEHCYQTRGSKPVRVLCDDLKKNDFVPIDHAFCFNTNNLDKIPYLISDNESLLDAPFINRFFNRHLQTKTNEIRLEILNEFRNDTNACCQQLELILAGMPSEWEPNRKYLKERLDFFFSDYWLTQCQNFFTRLFVQNLNSN